MRFGSIIVPIILTISFIFLSGLSKLITLLVRPFVAIGVRV